MLEISLYPYIDLIKTTFIIAELQLVFLYLYRCSAQELKNYLGLSATHTRKTERDRLK